MSQLSFSFETPSVLLSPDEIYDLADDRELLRRLKEDERLERKPAGLHARALGEYICMWSNTAPHGGLIAIGIGDKGLMSGCHKLTQEQINTIFKAGFVFCSEARTQYKKVAVLADDGSSSFVILIRVFYREDKVVLDSAGNAYVRVADEKHKLSSDETRELQIDKGQLDFEQELSILSYPEDFNLALVRRFTDGLKRVRQPLEDHSDIDLLEHRHLGRFRDGCFVPNNACVLLFGKNPLGQFPGCKVRFLRVEGEVELSGEEYNIVKDHCIEGPIPQLVEESASFIDSQLREFSRLGSDGKFFSATEYPRPAWYEALVNACVHRSYGLRNMNIFVKMFDDKLVIDSPGGFPPSITPKNIYGAHHPRNPHMIDAMFYLSLAKEHGEGTRRMRDTMEKMKLPLPEFKQTETGTGATSVRVTLRNNVKQRKFWIDSDVTHILGESLARTLTSDDERRIINFIGEHGKMNVSECLRLIPTLPKWHAAKRLLESMRLKGLLVHKHSATVARDAHAYYILPASISPQARRT